MGGGTGGGFIRRCVYVIGWVCGVCGEGVVGVGVWVCVCGRGGGVVVVRTTVASWFVTVCISHSN